MKNALLTTVLVSIVSAVSFADQCQYTTQQQAQRALEIVQAAKTARSSVISAFCEPCGDVQPQVISVYSSMAAPVGMDEYWGLFLNGSNVDLAYTYVNGLNLAFLAGCPAEGVSTAISFQK